MKWVAPVLLLFVLAGKSFSEEPRTRFIPVELWTGGQWDGKQELRMAPASLVFGRHGQSRITGPVPYVRPGTTEPIQVYERWNRGKKQLFALSSKGDGLGRVYDSRYERNCADEVKFPLGLWKQGEKRFFELSCDGGRFRRRLELTIEKIDFVHAGNPHSLQFHWLMDGGRGKGTDMRYVYSPGLGLVDVQGNE